MWGFELHAPPSRQELDPAAAVATTSRTEEINKKRVRAPRKDHTEVASSESWTVSANHRMAGLARTATLTTSFLPRPMVGRSRPFDRRRLTPLGWGYAGLLCQTEGETCRAPSSPSPHTTVGLLGFHQVDRRLMARSVWLRLFWRLVWSGFFLFNFLWFIEANSVSRK